MEKIIKKEHLQEAINFLKQKKINVELEDGLDYYKRELRRFTVSGSGKFIAFTEGDEDPEYLIADVVWDDLEIMAVDNLGKCKYFDFDDNERTIEELKAIKLGKELSLRKAIELDMPPWYIADVYQKKLIDFGSD